VWSMALRMCLSDEGDLGALEVLPSGEVLPPVFQLAADRREAQEQMLGELRAQRDVAAADAAEAAKAAETIRALIEERDALRRELSFGAQGRENRDVKGGEARDFCAQVSAGLPEAGHWAPRGEGGQAKTTRSTSASRAEVEPRPPQGGAHMSAQERPHSARRVRPSERALAGADAAARWPRLAIDPPPGNEAQSNMATVGADSDLSTLSSSEDGSTPSGPVRGEWTRRESVQSSHTNTSATRLSRVGSFAGTASLEGEQVQPLPDSHAGVQEVAVTSLENAMDQDKAAYAEKYCAEGKQAGEGEHRTFRRRYFSDLKGREEPRAFEIILAGSEPDHGSRDYLTWYYCDFLESNAPIGPAPPFNHDNETTADELCAWLSEFKPRTRADAYPMLQVAVCAIQKIVSKEVKMRSHQAETLIRLK